MSTLFWSLVRALRFALSHRHACSMFSAGTLTITSRPTAKTARALHSSTTAANPNSNLETTASNSTITNLLACPKCYSPLIWNGPVLSVGSTSGAVLQCKACEKVTFVMKPISN